MGRTKNKYILNLPLGYLSYSAWSLWKKDKNAFRRKYYEGEKSFETVETIFGKKIARMLETGEAGHINVRKYGTPEKQIITNLHGIELRGYLDAFEEEQRAFGEYKTGHMSKDGEAPWSRLKVLKHKQLDFYSVLIELYYGYVDPHCWLAWLETRFKSKTMEFAGHVLESQTRELELTGRVLEFPRTIYKYERENMKRDIIKVALEIHHDYEQYLRRSARVLLPVSEGVA